MIREGWIFDVYVSGRDMAVWMIDRDGQAHCSYDSFHPSFYVGGDVAELLRLSEFLLAQPWDVELIFTRREDLVHQDPIRVLQVQVKDLQFFPLAVASIRSFNPHLTLYNVALPLPEMYLVQKKAFPLAFCRFAIDEERHLIDLEVDDSPWALDYELPPLKRMLLRFAGDAWNPLDRARASIEVEIAGHVRVLPGDQPAEMLETLRDVLVREDPDLIVTDWGDLFLLPRLSELANQYKIVLPFDRDPSRPGPFPHPHRYVSHGRTLYRPSPQMLLGRWHIDRTNALLAQRCGLEGIFEVARLTWLPVQWAARAIVDPKLHALEMAIAHQQGVLIPPQAESQPGAPDLHLPSQRDGNATGLPPLSVQEDVAELRFVSLFPNLMERLNVSPQQRIGKSPDQKQRGLVPEMLAALLQKQREYIQRIAQMEQAPSRNKTGQREIYRRRESGLNLVLTTAFGYQGQGRMGSPDAYASVIAQAQECVILAKRVAERRGYRVLDATMDCLWVQKPGIRRKPLAALLVAITQAIQIAVALETTFRWMEFILPRRRLDSHQRHALRVAPYPYLGALEQGGIKVGGIDTERRIGPHFIAVAQVEMLMALAGSSSPRPTTEKYRDVIELVRAYADALRSGAVPLQELVITERGTQGSQGFAGDDEWSTPAKEWMDGQGLHNPEHWLQYILTEEYAGGLQDSEPSALRLGMRAPYDAESYVDLLLSAAEMILLPLQVPYQQIRASVERALPDKARKRRLPPSHSQSLARLFELVEPGTRRGKGK